MPAFPSHTFIDHSLALLSNTFLAEDAGVSSKPKGFVKSVIKGCFFYQVDRSVYPKDEILIEVVEIFGKIVRSDFTLPVTMYS